MAQEGEKQPEKTNTIGTSLGNDLARMDDSEIERKVLKLEQEKNTRVAGYYKNELTKRKQARMERDETPEQKSERLWQNEGDRAA
ncbi:MAG TPA: hypothetical protein VJI73_04205 [Candidatus Paceibacterota bacterium]